MENYIVRIYRRENTNPDSITGIVEKPDSGENISFRNNEEFFNIFVPSEASTDENHSQVMEQRKYRRFPIRNSTLIFDETTDVGEIIDISLGGLSFHCPNMPDESKGTFKVGILCEGAENFCTGRINCKKLMVRHAGNDKHVGGRKFGIEFDGLNASQKSQLEHIIKNCSTS
ncbi:PilZ domain-containing protein [Thermodesulfobacteriota bacterium]